MSRKHRLGSEVSLEVMNTLTALRVGYSTCVRLRPPSFGGLPMVRERIERLKKYRNTSTRPQTIAMAAYPQRLGVDERLNAPYLGPVDIVGSLGVRTLIQGFLLEAGLGARRSDGAGVGDHRGAAAA